MTEEEQTPIVLERTYDATVRELWDLWTTKEGFESWWGPDGFRAEVHLIEARVGGVLSYDMIAATPAMVEVLAAMGRPASHPTHSRFTELVPERRLVITNTIDFLPGVEPVKGVWWPAILRRWSLGRIRPASSTGSAAA